MPSQLHELLVDLFRRDPGLAALLLRDSLGVPIPRDLEPTLADANFSELAPIEARTDLVITFARDGRTELVLIIEVQLRRDEEKRRRWPYSLVSAAQRHRCQALLLVVASDAATARWAAKPIVVATGQISLTPLVLGPQKVARVQSPARARAQPYLAVLSALSHGRGAAGAAIALAAISALDSVDASVRATYNDLVLGALDEAARRALEAQMSLENYEVQSVLGKALVAKGEARGRASAVLAVLRARGLPVGELHAQRVNACTDLELLNLWLARAATAASADAVFRAE